MPLVGQRQGAAARIAAKWKRAMVDQPAGVWMCLLVGRTDFKLVLRMMGRDRFSGCQVGGGEYGSVTTEGSTMCDLWARGKVLQCQEQLDRTGQRLANQQVYGCACW